MINRIPKNIRNNKSYHKIISSPINVKEDKNKDNKDNTMVVMNEETVGKIDKIIKNKKSDSNDNVKTVKKDRGLIERVESSKVILTEDNKQLLKG